MASYSLRELGPQERVYVIKAIVALTGEIERRDRFDIALTVNGVEVDFLAFSRSMIGGVSTDLDARAREMIREKLDRLDAIIRELAAGL
jgi:hypothetical protein